MKLLASLLGCAVADYACCPYDEFGVVGAQCPLSEKTPWAMKDANVNADPSGVSNHNCKAWETNIDATMEGNEDLDNWGGCGFQRHFPWSIEDQKHGGAIDVNSEHCRMGMFNCHGGTNVNFYKAIKTGGTIFSLEAGGFSNGDTNHVFGQVTLGGVCKLWIPVGVAAIDSVSIAGVHMNGGGDTTNADNNAVAVFPGAEVCDTTDCLGNKVAGTAYCFSVVNVGEFMRNNMPGSAFQVMNANVAGKDNNGGAPILLPGPVSEGAFPVDFGGSIEPSAANAGTGTQVDSGANFDVVVHFKSIWCIRHWSIVDMQTGSDVGNQVFDYPLADVANVPQHAHTDVADKRFNGKVGLCGCCDISGTERHDADGSTTPSAQGCHTCAGCTEFNQYPDDVDATMLWPNAGAWAAFYSFITCSNSDFMIYDTLVSVSGGTITTTAGQRKLVHSMFYNDIRHDYSNAADGTGDIVIRGNFRQVGDAVTNCGPGEINTSDSKRCTWNWNFATNSDSEGWFERTAPKNVAVWKSGVAVDRNVEADAFSGLITDVVDQHAFTVTFQDDTDAASTDAGETRTFTLDAAKYFSAATSSILPTGHAWSFSMHCRKSHVDGTGDIIADPGAHADLGDTTLTNVRDMFPDCYMGDEIHFEYRINGAASGANQHRISSWYSFVEGGTPFST